jgi:uncharacterized protein
MTRILLAVALILGVAGVVAATTVGSTAPAGRTITVTGNGSVTAVPDRAGFSFGVDTQATSATDALARNATAARALVAALKGAGVSSDDLQTTSVSLSPQMSPDGTSVIGYDASSSVSASTALAKAGAIVDAAVGAGSTNVSGPNLTRSDQDALAKQALAKAVADAKDTAQAIAGAAGLDLGAVQSIVQGGAPSPIPFAGMKADASGGVPVEPGTLETDASVTVTYAVSG